MFTRATQCVRGVLDPPVSVFSLSLYRHPFLYTLFSSRFTLIINNNIHFVRVGGYIVNCQTFILTGSYRWPLFCSFRSSDCGNTTWHVPLPPRGVFCSAKSESRKHPRQGWSFTYQLKYWWDTYHFKNTYSPITLANTSSFNFVSIVRCFSSTSNVFHRTDTHIQVLSLALTLSINNKQQIQIRLYMSAWVSVGLPSRLNRVFTHHIRGLLVCWPRLFL